MSQTAHTYGTVAPEDIKARKAFGKREAKKIIKSGFVPATITSSAFGALHFSIKTGTVEKMIKSSSFFASPIELESSLLGNGQTLEKLKIVPKFIDFHPVNDYPLHIDFLHIQKETAILLIPIQITGNEKSSGLKKGGKLNIARYHVPLECDINNIPLKLEVNISSFGIGRSVFLSKLALPIGCKIVKDCLILSITGRGRKEKEEEAAAPAIGQAPAAAAAAPSPKTEAKK